MSVSIDDQLALEREMIDKGIENYQRNKDSALTEGRGSETGFARRLMDHYIGPMATILDEWKDKSRWRMARAVVHLREVDSQKAVFIALKVIFNNFTTAATPVNLANRIGGMIEDEIRFERFEEKFSGYYTKIMEDFKRKGTSNYRYMHRVLTHSANENEDNWNAWATTEKVEVGMRMLDLVLTESDLIQKDQYYNKGKTVVTIIPTDEAMEFIKKYDEVAELMHPRAMPCIIEPDDWTELNQGGYYTPELRSHVRMVITQCSKHRKILKKANLDKVKEALNLTQKVSWAVNDKVLDVARAVWASNMAVGMPQSQKLQPPESPYKDVDLSLLSEADTAKFMEWKREASEIYTKERERQGKCFQVTSILSMANKFRAYSKFYYVWCLDFRGRMYTATTGFSPQGPDLGKGMLRFSEGKRLGERGVYWLKVHMANRYGYDNVDFDDRVQWVDDNREHFLRAANDPLGNTDVWGKADKPYQFLAALFEYKGMLDTRLVGNKEEDYVSYLPVGLDGSCNGLQHFSAMLRDERGGRATNLISGAVPSDIYSEVAQVCLGKVKRSPEPVMREWEAFATKYGKDGNLPRSTAKRPVMTMPYGSTRQSCTEYINDSVCELNRKFFTSTTAFKASATLTPLMWESIGEVVVAAREGMDWLKKCASVMSKKELGITWRTNDGFIVYMFNRQKTTVKIDTVLAGRFQVRVGSFTNELNKHGQRNGVAPNFVHSMDASHLRAAVRRAFAKGITALALIHDDYGTYAADTDLLHEIIRETFVEQYAEFCPMTAFKEWQELISKTTMPELPTKGTLDINAVKDSAFFFS